MMNEGSVGRSYDLEERTAKFGEAVIDFARKIPRDSVTSRLISQLVGAATSVGANYCEADDVRTIFGHMDVPVRRALLRCSAKPTKFAKRG